MRRVCLVALLGLACATSACKPRQERGSEVRDVNRGAPMNNKEDPTASMRENKQKIVVIYYANDTYAVRGDDPARVNVNSITGTLRQAAHGEADPAESQHLSMVADKLDTEWERFRDAINDDIAVLEKRLCQTVVPEYQDSIAGFVSIRNFANDDSLNAGGGYLSRSLRSLKFTVCRATNSRTTEGHSFEVPRNEQFPFLSQPLSHPLAFQRALEAVRTPFPPDKHRYILITKSHGSEEIAIAPNLSVDMTDYLTTDQGRQELVSAVKGRKSIRGLEKMGSDPILADMDETLHAVKPQASADVGISKGDYIQILRDLGIGDKKQVMNFPIVLMESCRSDLRYTKDENISWVLSTMSGGGSPGPMPNGEEPPPDYRAFNMANVGWVYTSDRKGLGYKAVRYPDLNNMRFQQGKDFEEVFKSFLDSLTAGAPKK